MCKHVNTRGVKGHSPPGNVLISVKDCTRKFSSVLLFIVPGRTAVTINAVWAYSFVLIPSSVFPDWECRAGNETSNE